MKKSLLSIVFTIVAITGFCQKHSSSIQGSSLSIGTSYVSPVRSQFDKYLNAIESTLGLTGSIKPTTNIGLNFAYVLRSGSSEIEAGAGLFTGLRKKSSNAAGTATVSCVNKNFDIHFGYNKYLGGPLFLGFDLAMFSNGGKLEEVGSPASVFESTPNSGNPFKGYAFVVRPKAGLFLPFKKDNYSGFKLTAFYDLGVTKYEFYKNDIYDIRLKGYTGETKSSYNGFGAIASIIVQISK